MGYIYAPTGEEPKKLLLRRKDVIRWTGVSLSEFNLIASSDPIILPYKCLRPGGRRYYRKDDVVRVFFQRFKGGK